MISLGRRNEDVIDGQQRLTTIRLILAALGEPITHRLTYKARKKSDDTLKAIDNNKGSNINLKNNELDKGIKEGLEYAKSFLDKHVKDSRDSFVKEWFSSWQSEYVSLWQTFAGDVSGICGCMQRGENDPQRVG